MGELKRELEEQKKTIEFLKNELETVSRNMELIDNKHEDQFIELKGYINNYPKNVLQFHKKQASNGK